MYAKFFKRVLDFFIAAVAIIVLSPLLLIVTAISAFVMQGNPFFVQERPGRRKKNTDGSWGEEKIFKLIKFRSMTNAKDKKTGELLPDEKRLTGYGKFLRASSIDELPELINILKGDMAIIGPRPLLVEYLPRYSEEQRHRHDVRPGITGLAQAKGRNTLSWQEKFRYDVEYVNNVTFINDIKILFMTVAIVFKREGISSETSATMEEFKGN